MTLRIARLSMAHYHLVRAQWEEADLPVKPNGRDSESEIARQLALPQVALLGCWEGEDLLGSVLVTHDGRKGWVNRLAVSPAHRRAGVGRSLVRAAEEWLLSDGIGIFACIIEAGNDASTVLFQSAGYEVFAGAAYLTKRTDPRI